MVEEIREQGGSANRGKCEALIDGFARRSRRIDGEMDDITRHNGQTPRLKAEILPWRYRANRRAVGANCQNRTRPGPKASLPMILIWAHLERRLATGQRRSARP